MAPQPPTDAIYKRIAADLRARIADGRLRPGQRVGTIADLCHEYDVGQGTIVRAMTLLRFEGAVVGLPGEVPRVADKPRLQVVTVSADADVSFRLPTEVEAAELGISGGTWLAVVKQGGRTSLYPIPRTMIRVRRLDGNRD